MTTDREKFLQAIQSAEEIAASLESLQGEITSYKTASKELDEVRRDLAEFTGKSQLIAEGMNKILKIIQSISGPEILSTQRQISSTLEVKHKELQSDMYSLRKQVSENQTDLKQEHLSIDQQVKDQQAVIDKLKMPITVAAVASVLAVILSLLVLVMR